MAWLANTALFALAALVALVLAYQLVYVAQQLLAYPLAITLVVAAFLLYASFKRR